MDYINEGYEQDPVMAAGMHYPNSVYIYTYIYIYAVAFSIIELIPNSVGNLLCHTCGNRHGSMWPCFFLSFVV